MTKMKGCCVRCVVLFLAMTQEKSEKNRFSEISEREDIFGDDLVFTFYRLGVENCSYHCKRGE